MSIGSTGKEELSAQSDRRSTHNQNTRTEPATTRRGSGSLSSGSLLQITMQRTKVTKKTVGEIRVVHQLRDKG